jgi:hypothetical protein
MSALLYAALFFETSSEDECDPDLAVKQLEQIAAALRELTASEQDEFRSYAYHLATTHVNPAAGDNVRARNAECFTQREYLRSARCEIARAA